MLSVFSRYFSNSLRLTNRLPLPTKSTKGHEGLLSISLILLIPILLYSAASSIVSVTFSHIGTLLIIARLLSIFSLMSATLREVVVFEINSLCDTSSRLLSATSNSKTSASSSVKLAFFKISSSSGLVSFENFIDLSPILRFCLHCVYKYLSIDMSCYTACCPRIHIVFQSALYRL